MAKLYQEVYPFTTEMIAEYFSELDFKDKKVLTVGSSLDQAYNALLLGAKNIVVYDINETDKQMYFETFNKIIEYHNIQKAH